MKKFLSLILALVLSAVVLAGCANPVQTVTPIRSAVSPETVPVQTEPQPEALTGGVLCLKINPEIALHYDENGKVTKLEGRNADGTRLLEGFTGYEGKQTAQVLEELVELIGKAGYFVEEAEGGARKIVLELDPGSQVPNERFLEDMAAHVKLCVENKNWVDETDYEYDGAVAPTEAPGAPAKTPTAPPEAPAVPAETEAAVPNKLCPVCADDDCDDGKYCDDADEKAENLREAENKKNGTPCGVCGDYDCDDGEYCDDADEKAENLRELENKKNGTPCGICGDYDCDDGEYCDDADEKAENLREAENKKNGTPCGVCGEYDCDDGAFCDDWDDRYDDDCDDDDYDDDDCDDDCDDDD